MTWPLRKFLDKRVTDARAAVDEAHEQARTIRAASFVAEHWRTALLDSPYGLAHPLCMVLAALDGEEDPRQLGIDPESHADFFAAVAGSVRQSESKSTEHQPVEDRT